MHFLRCHVILCKVDFIFQLSVNYICRRWNALEMQRNASAQFHLIAFRLRSYWGELHNCLIVLIIVQLHNCTIVQLHNCTSGHEISRISLVSDKFHLSIYQLLDLKKRQTNESKMDAIFGNQQNTTTNTSRNADKYILQFW